MNVLTDVPFVRSTDGDLTVRETLRRAADIDFVRTEGPAYEVSATLRILEHVFALATRHGSRKDLLEKRPLSERAIDDAISDIGSAADLFDPIMPFLQRPNLPLRKSKDPARVITPGNQPVKKLSPSMPPEQAEDFWTFGSHQPSSLETADAVRALVVFYFYSPAGNNAYDGDKCAMGAPGLRFPGKDNSATEVFWRGPNLLATLAENVPRAWVTGGGLPAWADRTCEKSLLTGGAAHPLWRASWTSNAPACLWNDGRLVAVRIGGVPSDWLLPEMGKSKADHKGWWDGRNVEDPHYLYLPNKQNELKARRLDLGRDVTNLAAEWIAGGNGQALRDAASGHLVAPEAEDRIVFFRHLVGGTASSPVIRASEAFTGDSQTWAPDEDAAEVLRDWANTILELQRAVAGPFRRMNSTDKRSLQSGHPPAVFDTLETRHNDAVAYFWREVTDVFSVAVHSLNDDGEVSTETWRETHAAALRAFDAAIAPFSDQLGARAAYVRARVESRLRWIISQNGEWGKDK